MTYKTGTIGEFMKWTKSVVTDPASAAGMPKRWFDSDETAAKSLGTSASPEAMVKLLSPDNLALLHLIGTKRPESLRELALLAHPEDPISRERSRNCMTPGLWISSKGQADSCAAPYCAPRHS